jgi:putative nucleotidyltransferase with HDIG domain
MQIALELPVLPTAHARVLSLLGQQVASISEVVLVVESDPSLTASVLRTANSAASAPLSRIASTNSAIIRIGLSMTRRVLTGAVLKETFHGLERSGIEVDEMWRHLLVTALLAEGTTTDAAGRSASFTAGLLHDVGRLAMAASQPELYRRVVERVERGEEVTYAERSVLGVDHVEWGAEVGRTWEFPEDVTEAIANHHDGGNALAETTRRARETTWRLGMGDGLVRPEGTAVEDGQSLELLEGVGGREKLMKRVEWYRGALQIRAPQAKTS